MRRRLRLRLERFGPLTPPDDEPDLVTTEVACGEETGVECSV